MPETSSLLAELLALVQGARAGVARQINAVVVLTNYEVGRRIVIHEQGGEDRAQYGKAILQTLSDGLTAELGRGWSVTNLTLMRRFYLIYQHRLPKSQTASAISDGRVPPAISQTA